MVNLGIIRPFVGMSIAVANGSRVTPLGEQQGLETHIENRYDWKRPWLELLL